MQRWCMQAGRSLAMTRGYSAPAFQDLIIASELGFTASIGKMRAIFCGNLEYDSRQSDLEGLFRRYGRVERVDMKSGFAFVYMEDDRDADDAIRGLDRREFGRKRRRLCVEWTKERGGRRPESSRMISANSRPSKTLFVINFDPYHTKTRDLEKHFDPYGKIFNIRIKRNFAFVQYESQEDATRALDATNMSKLMDQVISVEYATKDDDNRRNGQGPDRTRDRSRSPGRGHDRRRSPSPYRREKASPDYGRGGGRSPSPYRRERVSPDCGRGPSPSSIRGKKASDGRSPSPYRRERVSPDYGRGPSPSSNRRKKPSEYGRSQILSPPCERPSPFNGRVTSSKGRDSLECRQEASPSAQRERLSPDDYRHGASPNSKFEVGDSPRNGAESPLQEIYRSRSSPSRERY